MVPSIYPLETLHNSLSLKQVDEFLNAVCEDSSDAHAKTMKGRYSSQGRYLALSRSNMPSLHTTDLIHVLFVLSCKLLWSLAW